MAENKKTAKPKKVSKKGLTKRGESGRILRLSRDRESRSKRVKKRFEKIFKKVLTKRNGCDIIHGLPQKRQPVTAGLEKKERKKLKKVLKNLLTRRKGCDIIDRLSRKRVASTARERERLKLDN